MLLTKEIKLKSIIFILLLSCAGLQAFEFKSNMLASLSSSGSSDLIVATHNTFLVGGVLKIGPYFAYERLHSYVTDTTAGGAIRIGEKTYFELQAGVYQRAFRDQASIREKASR